MAMDRLKDATQEDLICVDAQPLLRLLSQLRSWRFENLGLGHEGCDYRLATVYHEVRKIVEQARTCGHTEHLEDVPCADGEFDRLAEAINAALLEWYRTRR